MKSNFKRLGLAAAVTAVAVGYAGVSNAQVSRSVGNLGDTAIIPYYTVTGNWVTGVHIINSSEATQVVKLRLRRASDSADALDFNLILSPKDEWTGFIDDSSGNIVFATDDSSCTAPIRADGRFEMPDIYRLGAEEGYIEVIGMGQPVNELQPIAIAAKHTSAGVPLDCAGVASNFFANGSLPSGPVLTRKGVIDNATTHQTASQAAATAFVTAGALCLDSSGNVITNVPGVGATSGGVCQSTFTDSGDALKVSFFLRDAVGGTEMGNDAVHLSDFADEPWMTNQEFGLFAGDTEGFDFPDLDGGPWIGSDSSSLRGKYEDLRAGDVLGVLEVLNDWSLATARNVQTDWVVTMPGQYTMLDYYVALSAGSIDVCGTDEDGVLTPECDFRDIPVLAALTLYDREEGEIQPEEGDLVISPAPPGEQNVLVFPYEVNIVEWTDGSTEPVIGSAYNTTVDPAVLGEFGWASLSVTSSPTKDQKVCDYDDTTNVVGGSFPNAVFNTAGERAGVCTSVGGAVPITGFVAWQRSFESNPTANYGRMISHSFVTSTAP
jgi:hypothetical protein